MNAEQTPAAGSSGLVVCAYDGSELATLAIQETGRLLGAGREALVLTVWEPFSLGFLPVGELQIDAAHVDQVRQAAEETAAHGASVAQGAGFRALSMSVRATPTWRGIIEVADERDASLIALGSHGRTGLASVVIGSVASAVAAHSRRTVLIVHHRS
jgi:nucleotide-binding universal stress UspA family protein